MSAQNSTISGNSHKRLTWKNILGYGLGDVANNFFFAMGTFFLLNYYTDVAGIPILAAGTLLASVRIYDAIVDIIAGRVIDRTETRWGRFRPFIFSGALPLMALGVAVFSVPQGWGAEWKLLYAYVTYALFGTVYSFTNIPYGALASAMTQEPNERARLGICRTFMAVCTYSFLTMTVGPAIAGLKGAALQEKITQFTLIMAISGVILYFLCVISTKENIPRNKIPLNLKESIAVLLKNQPLQMLCISTMIIMAGSAASGASLIFYARYLFKQPGQFFLAIGMITLATTFIATPLVPFLVRKFGKKSAFLIGIAISVIGYTAIFSSQNQSTFLIYSCFAISFLGTRIFMSILWAIEADTVEYGEWCSGIRCEGLNYSLFSLSRKCGQALGATIPAFLLSYGGYIPNAEIQSKMTQLGIMQSLALAPIVFFTMAFIIMIFYPITDERFLIILKEIEN